MLLQFEALLLQILIKVYAFLINLRNKRLIGRYQLCSIRNCLKLVHMNASKIYVFLFTLCFIACEEAETIINENGNNIISFSIGISNVANTKVSTDSDLKSTFDYNDEVGIFIYIRNEGEESSVDDNELYISNLKLKYVSGMWELENPIYYPDSKKLLDIYAYYPYKDGVDVHSLEYNAHEEMNELLMASVIGIKKSEDTIKLKFQHILSFVHVTLMKDNNVPDFDDNLNVNFNGIIGGKYNIATQELTEPMTGVIKMDLIGEENTNTRSYTAFVPEQEVAQGILFSVFQTTSDNKILSSKDIDQPEIFTRGYFRLFIIRIEQEIPKDIVYYKYDLYPKYGTPIGMVIDIYNEGKNGLLVSLKNIAGLKWATSDAMSYSTGATDLNDGISNTMKIQSIENWETKYPAFSACIAYGERWYIPSIGEMAHRFSNGMFDYTLRNLNDNLRRHSNNNPELGIETVNSQMSYFSSTESSASHATKLYPENGTKQNDPKDYTYYIRPFYIF